MEDLIRRLEASEVGSRELDLRVFEKFDLVDGERWSDADLEYALTDPDRTINPPRLTQSLDAALALAERVLEGWAWKIDRWGQMTRITLNECDAEGWHRSKHQRIEVAVEQPPALALCIAILRAKLIDTAQNPR